MKQLCCCGGRGDHWIISLAGPGPVVSKLTLEGPLSTMMYANLPDIYVFEKIACQMDLLVLNFLCC